LKRKTGKYKWFLKLNDLVLVKQQLVSDFKQGVTTKFQRPYEGPYIIKRSLNQYSFEVTDEKGKLKSLFNIKHLKQYQESNKELTVGSLIEEINNSTISPQNMERVSASRLQNLKDWEQWKITSPPKRKTNISNYRTCYHIEDTAIQSTANALS
jgi:hypothetical protein